MKNKKRFNLIHFIGRLIYRFKNLSFIKHILLFYLIITIVGASLLFAPFAQRPGQSVSFWDALFTAASAFSDTGLASKGTAETWSIGGQAIISMLIMVGGIGWFALKVYLVNIIFGRPISFASRDALAAERGSDKVGFSKNIIKVAVTILLITMLIASVVLTIFFFYVSPSENPYHVTGTDVTSSLTGKSMVFENPQHDLLKSIRFGIFHSISALNNAGFDIIGGNSIAPYYHEYGLQAIFIILFVVGGMGYPVIYDVWSWLKAKRKGEKFYWSLFTKLSVLVYTIVSVTGVASTFLVELTASDYKVGGTSPTAVHTFWNNPMYGSTTDRGMALFFNSMSTRNAGFSTIRMGDLAPTTILLFSVLMFIGSAPSSTAGGIRTTTLGVAIVGLWGKIRGRDQVRMFNRRVSNDTVIRSYIVITASLIIVILSTIIAYTSFAHSGGMVNSSKENMFMMRTSDPGESYVAVPYSFTHLIFETTSAFGTTGLSAGLTSSLSLAAKITLIFVMFMGQLGVSSTILIWRSRKTKSRNYNFIEEDITIG